MKRSLLIVLIAMSVALMAPNPGHPASSVGPGTFASGSFTFPNQLAVNGNFVVNTSNLFVNTTNGRVGIGTENPEQRLHINGNLLTQGNANITGNLYTQGQLLADNGTTSNPSIAFAEETNTGWILAETNNPHLIIDGQTRIRTNIGGSLQVLSLTGQSLAAQTWIHTGSGNEAQLIVENGVTYFGPRYANTLHIQTGNKNPSITINGTGSVGIGTENPQTTLDINGSARIAGTLNTSEICLDGDCQTAWPSGGEELSQEGRGNRWIQTGNLNVIGHTSVVYDNKIWTIGGWGTSVVRSSEDGVTWNTAGNFPRNIDGHASVVYDNKIWVIGGISSSVTQDRVYSSTDGNTWNFEGTLPDPIEAHAAVVYDGKMWVIGGSGSSGGVYSSINGSTWNLEGTMAQTGHSALVYDDKMWVIGGWSSDEVYSSTDGNTWNLEGSLPEINTIHSAVVYNNQTWVIAGYDGSSQYYDSVYVSGDGSTWTQVGTIPQARGWHTSVVYKGEVWTIGGWDGSAVDNTLVTAPVIKGGLYVTDGDITLLNGSIELDGYINQTASGTVRTFANGCQEIANTTGVYMIC